MNRSYNVRLQHGLLAIASAAILIAAPGCVTSGRLSIRTGPPSAVVERRTQAPGPDYVWIDGYYRHSNRQYVWVSGRWARKPNARAVWMPGRWVNGGSRGWYFIEGHWR